MMASISIVRNQHFLKIAVNCQSIARKLLTPSPVSVTSVQCLHQGWRRERKLPQNPNASGILTDKPDYSFLDGRPTPLGMGVKRRMEKQNEYAKKIVMLSKEMDFAVKRYDKLLAEREESKQRKLNSKLKPKGYRLLKSK
ncbi:39S ribosomal protein L52 [Blattella germanica]|nr:39S ribosomal protein L52 [Blattella germanica]